MRKGNLIRFSYRDDISSKNNCVGIITKINEYQNVDGFDGWKQVNKIKHLDWQDYLEVFLIAERKRAIISSRTAKNIKVVA